MTTADHNEFRDWAGAYTLGALEPDDRRAFEGHLTTCTDCANHVRSFAPIAGLLAQSDRSELDPLLRPETAAEIGRKARNATMQVELSRRRWRIAALTSCAAAILLLAGLVVDRSSPQTETTTPAVVAATVTVSQAETSAVFTSARGWGTEIRVELSGLPARDEYRLWAVDREGVWSTAATWGPTATGGARVTGATRIATDSVARIVVTSQNRDDVLVDASN